MRATLQWISLQAAAIAAAFVCGCTARDDAPQTPTDQPHVVVIVLDTLRADVVGCYGGPAGVSPELDAWANEGMRFARVTAPSNWTKPSWAALLTGRHPRSLGVYQELGECLPDNAITLAEAFQEEGYETYGATANPNINAVFNYHQGFDVYRDSNVVWDWMKISTEGDADHVADNAKLPAATDMYRDALAWAADQDGPCYIQIATMEMHEYHRGEYSLNRPEFRDAFPDVESPEREYYQALKQSSIDAHQFIEDLKELPGWNDVLVVVTSDHGEGLSDHPGVSRSEFHGGVMYDSNLHVPFIAVRPGVIPAGRVVDQPVALTGLVASLLAFADATSPAATEIRNAAAVTAEEALADDCIVSESYLRDIDKIAISSGGWRYIENRDAADPDHDQHGQLNAEALQRIGAPQNGIATDQIGEHPEIAAALRERLRAWEANNPKAPASTCGNQPDDEVLEQLRAIGYIDGEREQHVSP